MTTWTCSKCGVDFERKRPGYCPPCQLDYNREWSAKNPARVAAYAIRHRRTPEQDRARYVRRMRALHGPDWAPGRKLKSTEEKRATARLRQARKRAKNGPAFRARKAVENAVSRGRIHPLPCWTCGSVRTEAHHPAYSMPLDVVWLCSAHHHELHASVP